MKLIACASRLPVPDCEEEAPHHVLLDADHLLGLQTRPTWCQPEGGGASLIVTISCELLYRYFRTFELALSNETLISHSMFQGPRLLSMFPC